MQDMTEPAWLGKMPKTPWGGVAQKFVGVVHFNQKQIALYYHPKNEFLNKFLSKGSCQNIPWKIWKINSIICPKIMSTQDENF